MKRRIAGRFPCAEGNADTITTTMDIYAHVTQKGRQQSADKTEQYIRKVWAEPANWGNRNEKALEPLQFQGFSFGAEGGI